MRLQICYGKNWRGQVSRFVGKELNKIEKKHFKIVGYFKNESQFNEKTPVSDV